MPDSDEDKVTEKTESAANVSSTENILTEALGRMFLRKEKPKIPIFSGRDATKREASFEDWFHVVNRAISTQHVYKLDDREMSDVIFASLAGEARSRFIRLDRAHTSLGDILSSLEQAYSDQTSAIERMQELHTMSQLKSETVSQFADRLEATAYALEQCSDGIPFDTNQTLKAIFMRGLRMKEIKNLMEHLRDDKAKTYENVRAKAVMLEKEQRTERPDEKKLTVKPIQSDLEKTVLALTAQVQHLQKSLEASQAAATQSTQQHSTPSKNRASLKCFYCDKPGHFARDCQLKKQAMAKREAEN